MNDDPRKIIHLLANGVDPITGEILPGTSPYNHPQVIRALFAILEESNSAKRSKAKADRNLPAKHGKPWMQEERDYTAKSYKNNVPLKEIAAHLQRTSGSIRSELIRQGLIRQGLIQLDEQPVSA